MLHLILATLVSVSVSPAVCFDPCTLTVTLRVEPSRDNEKVVLEIGEEGIEPYRKTDLNYTPWCNEKSECRYSPKTVQIRYPGVPAGNYNVTATLYKHDAKTWVAGSDKKKVTVAGPD